MTESDEQPALKSFELTEEQLAVLPPSMGGPRRKTPRKPHAPWQDPPELLIPNGQMTDELWAAWERPLDHEKIPSNTRKVALMLWRRDGNICQVCGLSVEIHLRKSHPGMASPDHIVPVRRYDPEYDASHLNVWGNVRLTHLHCNTAHRDFGAELIAVEDYRQMLRTAVREYEDKGNASPPETSWVHLSSPHVTQAWELEQTTGRPEGAFGEEWTTPRL